MNPKYSASQKAPLEADLSLLAFSDSSSISGSSPDPLAQIFSDPDPTTMLVSGSEKDASGEEMNSKMKKMAAVRGGWGDGNGEKTGTKRLREITARERELIVLTFCYEHGFVTRRIAENFLLTSVKHDGVSRILSRLVKRGLLIRLSWAKGRGVYQLTRAGRRIGETYSNYKDLSSFRIKTKELDHDETTMEVRLLLERLLGGRWKPERSLKTGHRRDIPDGLLQLGPQAEIAVEVELTDKGKTRLEGLLTRWEAESISLVLYVCGDLEMLRLVQRSMKKFPNARHLATTTLASLRAGKREIWTPAGEKRLFTEAELS